MGGCGSSSQTPIDVDQPTAEGDCDEQKQAPVDAEVAPPRYVFPEGFCPFVKEAEHKEPEVDDLERMEVMTLLCRRLRYLSSISAVV